MHFTVSLPKGLGGGVLSFLHLQQHLQHRFFFGLRRGLQQQLAGAGSCNRNTAGATPGAGGGEEAPGVKL